MSDGSTAGAAGALPIALFIDFDGTLVDIADTPDGVSVPDAVIAELRTASQALDAALVVVSGREIADLDSLLEPLTLPVAGSHGAHRRRPDGTQVDLAPDAAASAAAIADRLAPFAAADARLLLERKSGAVALHYRRAPERAQACREAMRAATAGISGFRLLEGKMVIEARPATIDKGEAVRAFMSEPPFVGRVPIFIGDDVTDEDGFRAAQDMGGVGIKIGDGPTAAQGRLPDVAAARALLRRIGEGRPFAPSASTERSNANV